MEAKQNNVLDRSQSSPLAHEAREVRSVLADDDPRSNNILISLLGLSTEDRIRWIDVVARRASADGECPIFLTDHPDFAPFIAMRHLYEYLPPIKDQLRHAAGRRWDLYLAARMRLILAKWRPRRVESCGKTIPEFIASVAAAHGYPKNAAPGAQ